MSGPSDADHNLRWPAGFSPERADVWARGEVVIQAAPPVVFAHLIAAVLAPDGGFEFELNGHRLCARVAELLPSSRLAWSGLGIDISTYHVWVISGDLGRSRVLAGFAARGAAAVALRETDPGAARATLDRWLADLKTAAESARP